MTITTEPDEIKRLLEIMRRLRDPESGCPWDVEQTFETIVPYTIEEAYEVADAIERQDWAELQAELGDLLLQVVYHSQMANEAGLFEFDTVAKAIGDKMVERHPHVFDDARVASAAAQTQAWEAQKARERQSKAGDRLSALDGVARGLPALMRAEKLQKRAARVGFDWQEAPPVLAKIREELEELEAANTLADARGAQLEELGDLLFSIVNYARHLDIDPEEALRHANAKFERRFRALETQAAEQNLEISETTIGELERLWQNVKRVEEKA
ncbi:MAG: nucleoside triphosphate pyrophosphohydrolase [Pseudomonadota bacterium]